MYIFKFYLYRVGIKKIDRIDIGKNLKKNRWKKPGKILITLTFLVFFQYKPKIKSSVNIKNKTMLINK